MLVAHEICAVTAQSDPFLLKHKRFENGPKTSGIPGFRRSPFSTRNHAPWFFGTSGCATGDVFLSNQGAMIFSTWDSNQAQMLDLVPGF